MALKVLGGIKGIANSSECLEEYFSSSAEMSNIIAKDEVRKWENHYQLSQNRRIQDDGGKVSEVFHTHDFSFDGTDGVFNILTEKVLPQPSAERSLDVQKNWEEEYEFLVKERIEGDSLI